MQTHYTFLVYVWWHHYFLNEIQGLSLMNSVVWQTLTAGSFLDFPCLFVYAGWHFYGIQGLSCNGVAKGGCNCRLILSLFICVCMVAPHVHGMTFPVSTAHEINYCSL